MKNKGILLDRDGTIIIDKIYLNDPKAVEFLPNCFEGMRLLRDEGFEFSVVTNQSGIARGIVQMDKLDEIHAVIQAEMHRHGLHISSFHYAPYMTDYNHPYRKPNSGMLLEASRWNHFDPAQSWMIGDRMSDVEAGHRAGMRSVLIGTSEDPRNFPWSKPEVLAQDLLEAARKILSHNR